MIVVEVIYASEDKQTVFELSVPENTTVEQAINLSRVCQQHPEIDLKQNPIGIFSKKVQLTTQVQEGDRIEIYRPLKQDPKDRRLKKAK